MRLPASILARAKPTGAPAAPKVGGDFLEVEFPLLTVSEANRRDHWRVKAKRVRHQRNAVQLLMGQLALPPLPAEVTLTRLGVGRMDPDNLAGSLKAVQDQVAALYFVDDGSPLYRWRYDQIKNPTCRVRISIRSVGEGGGANG